MAKTVGTVRIGVGISTKELQKNLNDVSYKLKRSSRKWKEIGMGMSTAFTLPFVAIGGASVKMASELETNFSKIKNLVGVGGEQLEEFKKGVSSLSGEVGRSQRELSDALFDITSAGFKGAEGMNVLREASKLSVIGMGDVNSIASSLTGTLFSFSKQNVSASKAAAVLFKTAQLGKFKVEELSGAMSGLNVIAAQMGVKIEEAGALTAQYSKTGKNASESATGFEAALQTFLVTSPKVVSQLKDMGTNLDDVRASISERGFLATMKDLDTRAKETGTSIGDLFGRKEGRLFVMSLLDDIGASEEALGSMFDTIAEKEAAFGDASKTSAQTFKSAMVNLQNVGIELGTILLPAVTDIVKWFTNMSKKLKDLNPNILKFAFAVGGVLAVIGPVAFGIGQLTGAFASLIGILKISGGAAALLNPWVIVIGALAIAVAELIREFDTLKSMKWQSIFKSPSGMAVDFAVQKAINKTKGNKSGVPFSNEIGKDNVPFYLQAPNKEEVIRSWKDILSDIDGKANELKNKFKLVGREIQKALSPDSAIGLRTGDYSTKHGTKRDLDLPSIKKSGLSVLPELLDRTALGMDKVRDAASSVGMGIADAMDIGKDSVDRIAVAWESFKNRWAEPTFEDKIMIRIQALNQFNEGLNAIVNQGLTNLAIGFGKAIGQLATGVTTMDSIFAGALSGFAGLMEQLGQMAIQTGLTLLLVEKSLKSLNPYLAIAGGIALIALAQGVKSKAANIGGEITGMAEGGIVPGGYPNDSFPAMLTSGETVIPLSRLKGMMGGNTTNVVVSGRISGYELKLVQDRSKTKFGRI